MNIDPEQEGVRAYNEGLDQSANPYEYTDDAAAVLAWETGWQNARTMDLNNVLNSIKVGKAK